jgi:hypothetical protein
MNKDVSTVFLLDETKSLLFTKPLYSPFCQNTDLL